VNLNHANRNNILVPKKQIAGQRRNKTLFTIEQIINSLWTNWNNILVPHEQELDMKEQNFMVAEIMNSS
jgi:hypothetical protein